MEFAAGIGTIIEFVNACEVYIMPRSTFERCTHSSQVWQVVSILDAGNRDVDASAELIQIPDEWLRGNQPRR